MPKITSRPPSAAYAAGWDRIFGKKTVTVEAVQHMVSMYRPPKMTMSATVQSSATGLAWKAVYPPLPVPKKRRASKRPR